MLKRKTADLALSHKSAVAQIHDSHAFNTSSGELVTQCTFKKSGEMKVHSQGAVLLKHLFLLPREAHDK